MMASTRTSRMVAVEHVRVYTARSFAEVVRGIEGETGVFDARAVHALLQAEAPPGEIVAAIAAMAGRSGLMRFATLDHGAILRAQGQPALAVRFLIGHPLTAARMTAHGIGSALYAPLSLLVAAADERGTFLEYDRPSTLLGQFEDARIDEVARELDAKIAALVDG
jgi:uncharacterized protein (DUF302 family)